MEKLGHSWLKDRALMFGSALLFNLLWGRESPYGLGTPKLHWPTHPHRKRARLYVSTEDAGGGGDHFPMDSRYPSGIHVPNPHPIQTNHRGRRMFFKKPFLLTPLCHAAPPTVSETLVRLWESLRGGFLFPNLSSVCRSAAMY